MTQINRYLLWALFVCLLGTASFLNAQNSNNTEINFREGTIVYDIKVVGMPEIAEFFRETTLSLYLSEDKSKLDLKIMGGFASMQLLSSFEEQLHTVLMDIPFLSDKISIPFKKDDELLKELTNTNRRNQTPKHKAQLQFYHKDTRRIAKYKCYRAEMPMDGSRDYLVMYLAKKIQVANSPQMLNGLNVSNGFPLGIELSIDGVYVRLTAISVSKKPLTATEFEIPEEYSEMSFDKFRQEIEEKFGGTKKEGVGL